MTLFFFLSIFSFSSIAFFSAPPALAVACIGAGETCRPSATCSGFPDETPIGLCNDSLTTCCRQTAPTAPQIVAVQVNNPVAFTTVEGVLDSLLGSLQAIIAILSLIFIVIGGILYMTAAGDEGRLTTAKSVITAALIGLALGIAAPSFLKQIGEVLGWGPIAAGAVATSKTLAEIATSVLNFLLSVVGVVGIIMLVVGGLMYLTSAGDEERINTGKKIVQYSIIGVMVALAALVIVTQLAGFFS